MSIYDKASLVLIPSGTKTSKVYSQKPVSGDGDFTFSRSTAATRVNADGNIEKETQNLVPHSNTFSSWHNQGNDYTLTSGQSGYDGSSDAWLLAKGSTQNKYLLKDGLTDVGVFTASLYAKAGTADGVMIYTENGYVRFDLTDGTKINGGSAIDDNIEDVGNGWYRCSVTGTGTRVFYIKVVNDTGVETIGNIYIQDAQLEQGLVARDYIETTTTAVEGGITDNVPRLDYTDSSCPALLLEPQRSNLFEFSEYFETSDWSKDNIGLTTNDSESPEGVNNATLVYPAATQSSSPTYIYNSTTGSSSFYTISAFVKADGLDVCWLYMSSSSTYGIVYFDLSDESIQVVAGSASTPTGTITDMGDGWYRITATLGAAAAIASGSGLGVSDAKGNWAVTKNGEDGILVYGLQIEAGSYATSYIPTYGSAVTRNE